jgi:hypothetical protein
MGFRSTFTTSDYNIKWPEWFFEKYKERVLFSNEHIGAISSKGESKHYTSELVDDIQKAIDWNEIHDGINFILVYLHECGGITRCEINRDSIMVTEPCDYKPVRWISHNYCYGCSDAKHLKAEAVQ